MSSRMQTRVLLSIMMFLEYAVWGAWAPILGATLGGRLHATGASIGAIYGILWIAFIITPFIGGQLVDRYMSGQLFLAIASVVCAVAAFMMSKEQNIGAFSGWMWVWSLAFAPTLGITNSIAFYHLRRQQNEKVADDGDRSRFIMPFKLTTGLTIAGIVGLLGFIIWRSSQGGTWSQTEITGATISGIIVVIFALVPMLLNDMSKPDDVERSFSVIRTAGTVGWIIASMLLTAYLLLKPATAKGAWAPYEEMQLTAIFGVALTLVALFIPNTPPSKEAKDPWAFTKAFTLFKLVPGFTVFMIISFLINTEFQFYYTLSAPFLEDKDGLNANHAMIPLFKSIAQYAEIACLGILTPFSLKYLGMKKTLVIGAIAWPARYFLFALMRPDWLVLASMSLHGIGFAFVFVTSFIYIDRVAPKDIRASAQGLFNLITLGIGNTIGSFFSGYLKDYFTHDGHTNWRMVFVVPAALTISCAIAFWLTFKEPKKEEASAAEVAAV